MMYAIGRHHDLGRPRLLDLPEDPLGWRVENLIAYRDFVIGRLTDKRSAVAVVQGFREDFDRMMERRSESLRDYFRVSQHPHRAHILHETPMVGARVQNYTNPTLPWLRFRLAGLLDRLEAEAGLPELDGGRAQYCDWIRDLGASEPRRGVFMPSGFLKYAVGVDFYGSSAALSVADQWLRVERVNKTNLARLRLVTPARQIVFPNTRRSRLILARIRRCWWRIVLLAVADRLSVYFVRGLDGSRYEQLYGIPAQKAAHTTAWIHKGGRAVERVFAAVAPALEEIGTMEWSNPRLKAAQALWSANADWLKSTLGLLFGGGPLELRLDEPAPDVLHKEPNEEEARMLQPFTRDGQQWWRVFTFDCFRDYPIGEFPSYETAVRFLRANAVLSGIRIALGTRSA